MASNYYRTKSSVDEYIKMSKGISGIKLIEKLKPFLPKQSDILEIGTGPGTDWKLLNKDFSVVGSDNSLEFLNHLRSNYPNGKFLELDAVTLETEQKFDSIYSNKVLHHLNENELYNSIIRQSAILKPNGIICHSFWKGNGSEVYNGLFVKYYNKEELHTYFETHFKILLIDTYEEFEPSDSLLLIATKK